jgi:hypothetical protein
MRAWCPRCDAVRPGETVCPACATPLATLEDPAAAGRRPDLPAPEAAAAPPPARPRLRVALVAATLVVAALAFVAGRSVARPAAPAATAAPATSTTAPEPEADFRRLGWAARRGGITVTAVDASRLRTDERETVAMITFRIDGLPAGRRVLALRGLRLLDAGGGAFSSLDHQEFDREGGVPVEADERRPGIYSLATGPAPRLSALARIELAGLLVVQPRDQAVQLDTAGPWPAGPPLRAVDPGQRNTVRVDLDPQVNDGIPVELRVTSAFVGGGRAVVVVDFLPGMFAMATEFLPISAELRAGDRALCSRTSLLTRDVAGPGTPAVVLVCPTGPVPRLSVALGVGVGALPFRAALRP